MSLNKETPQFAPYREILSNDLQRVAKQLGVDSLNAQIMTVPPVYPFVLGVNAKSYMNGEFTGNRSIVTKVIVGSTNPNLEPVPSKGVSENTHPDSPHVVYHVYDGENTHWFHPYAKDGKISYFYNFGGNEPKAIAEYFASNKRIAAEIDTKNEARMAKQQQEENRKVSKKKNFRKDMDLLKKEGRVVDTITAVAKRLYSGANIDLKDIRYKASFGEDISVKEVEFSKKGSREVVKKLVFVPSGGGLSTDESGWFIQRGEHREKVGPDRASNFIATLA